MNGHLRMQIRDFRAIAEADISLRGITVITGVNGCGKSTLSKFLYYSFKSVNDFNNIVDNDLYNELFDIRNFTGILSQEIKKLGGRENFLTDVSAQYRQHRNKIYSLSGKDNIIMVLKRLENEYNELRFRSYGISGNSSQRLTGILADILSENNPSGDFSSLMERLYNKIEDVFSYYAMVQETRPLGMVEAELASVFDYGNIPGHYSIKEYGDDVISTGIQHASYFHSVKNSVYIDTPMLLGADFYSKGYWDDVNALLKRVDGGVMDNSVVGSILHSHILKGESNYREDEMLLENFIFRTDSGKTYNLLDCATGVKSFSILQMLLKNGFMSDDSFMIIDEPEVHLHPQWIVEYARMIVLLNKYFGVRFLIASHNPDMVSAIRYISEKEGIAANLNFYLAELSDYDEERFRYRNLGLDIDPIFESFNIALDRINLYGITGDGE